MKDILADTNKKDICRPATAESNRIDIELVRQRHKLGPKERQSRTPLPLFLTLAHPSESLASKGQHS
ncbi:hypothetical protein DPMN_073128 [Dreissena polymorpha]|uniref:Uncharacterized protein n=1 Tax=Dreissena polymorpha TaxID=45954 RepID=A0A9D4HCT4_DREPO|nr:hypothetical protein DPMN_073128 [Dreissena polymorpha]